MTIHRKLAPRHRAVATLLFGLAVVGSPILAEDSDTPFLDLLPKQPFEAGDDTRFFTLAVENDLLGSGSDRHYTSGIRATWLDLGRKPWRVNERLMNLVSDAEDDAPSGSFISFGQNLYTPRDITAEVPDPDDRPYAAFLYFSTGLTRASGDHYDTVELTFGLIGPSALGEESQSFVHDLVGGDDPRGWDQQLADEPAFFAAWERRWPLASTDDFGPVTSRLMPHVGVNLGNVYTHVAGGVTWQLVPADYGWQSPPLRVRPAAPGSGFFYPETDGIGWSTFLSFEARGVARNIFIDGNTFEDSPSVDREPLVYDVSFGFSVAWSRLRAAYTLNWRSKEFVGQQEAQVFGALSISRRF